MDILSRIKRLAAQKKISIAQLERDLDFSNGSISKWNKTAPSIDKLQAVADYFDISADFLLGREEKKNIVEYDPDIRTLHRAVNDMSPEQRKKAINVWEAVFDDLFGDE